MSGPGRLAPLPLNQCSNRSAAAGTVRMPSVRTEWCVNEVSPPDSDVTHYKLSAHGCEAFWCSHGETSEIESQ